MKHPIYKSLLLLSLAVFSLIACSLPGDLVAPSPSGLSQLPPEAEDDDPQCLVKLKCIIENTSQTSLRVDTQKVINQLFSVTEPEYTEICTKKSKELLALAPECQS